jgi:hypothetical protein
MSVHEGVRRREFLKIAGAVTALEFVDTALALPRRRVAIVIDADDPVASSTPVRWAAEKLKSALVTKGERAEIVSTARDTGSHATSEVASTGFVVVVASAASSHAKEFRESGKALQSSESLRLVPGHFSKAPATLVSGADATGYIYGLLELAERVQFGRDALGDLHPSSALEEKPANVVRSVARAFLSEIEDKTWYYDKDFWRGYLDMLAASRFNRFNFALGFGYDFPRGVTGDYFHFPYPYLVDVPGYNVRVVPLEDAERDRNLEMLRFIGTETAGRGIQFQLGIWTHAYAWVDSPHADHHIEGLTAETHAPYCRDALAFLLKSCPEIQGLTLRVHGESGIPEGSYPFWQTLFEAIAGCGRAVEIDMHAKGINQTMIDMAVRTGMSVKVSPKYAAEHQSLGYHQADIRELEMPRTDRMETGIFSVSNGERRFTRYGYADLFDASRRYDVLFRLWPGTQRHLLSGDPAMAAAYGRTAHICGASGLEICEPLTFKGREGSGQPGGRCAYADASLNPKGGDWQKFEYAYRLWGRLLYAPETNPETWLRYLRNDFGPGAEAVETALANASRILPLLTSAHLPSASNHSFWPEIYTNMPIVLGDEPSPYSDTPEPRCFGTVSPLDPQLFSTIVEHAKDLIDERPRAKYSPVEVAQWLEEFATAADRAMATARKQVRSRTASAFRRIEEDVLIQTGLGYFFTAKLRSGMFFEIYRQTNDASAGTLALAEYRKARIAWATMAERAKLVYRSNIAYGSIPMRRGHWVDRLANINLDIAAMEAKLKSGANAGNTSAHDAAAIRAVTERPHRPTITCQHHPPSSFRPGDPLALALRLDDSAGDRVSAIHLFYRHVNQAERWQSLQMDRQNGAYQSAIPAQYTNSAFPLQYYFEFHGASLSCFHPAFNATLSNQPYYIVSERTS